MRIITSISLIILAVMLAASLADLAFASVSQANDDTGMMYCLVLGNRIPYEYFVTMGHNDTDLGPGDDPWETGSYDLALMDASIENFNVLKYTSVLPSPNQKRST